MKRGRLPLTALRSFEAAGRHGSFSKAAEELFVSQAAVSRQIRDLETTIGAPLFERLHRKVALTENGTRLLRQVSESFDAIDHALSAVMAAPQQQMVKVSVEPCFAGLWLVPKLDVFNRLHPDIDASLDVDGRVIEFRRDEPQVAIRYSASRTSWPRARAEHLADISVAPVLCPDLLASGPPLSTPADLLGYTLLHDESRDGWSRWLEAAGVHDAAPRRGPIFTDSALATQAAKLGHGVALGDIALIGEELRTGQLVMPFPISIPYGAYWLVTSEHGRPDRAVEAFTDWLKAELTADLARGRQA